MLAKIAHITMMVIFQQHWICRYLVKLWSYSRTSNKFLSIVLILHCWHSDGEWHRDRRAKQWTLPPDPICVQHYPWQVNFIFWEPIPKKTVIWSNLQGLLVLSGSIVFDTFIQKCARGILGLCYWNSSFFIPITKNFFQVWALKRGKQPMALCEYQPQVCRCSWRIHLDQYCR